MIAQRVAELNMNLAQSEAMGQKQKDPLVALKKEN